MGGWFDAFRTDSGPTWYGDNRTPVVVDMTTVSIVFVFSIFLFAFLIIFPGIRRQRWSSFLTVVTTLSVGAIILVCIHYPSWHVGQVQIYSEYRSYSSERLDSSVGVKVGLKFCNITLRASTAGSSSKHHYFDYNERFHFTDVRSLQRELADSLTLGLPFPILTVVEYLSVDRAGFIWGRMYRLAGHYTCILLWTAFSMWLLQLLFLSLVPAYFSRSIFSVGLCLLLADLIYFVTCPHKLAIYFPGPNGETAILYFRFGWCFWTILGVGIVSVLVGAIMRTLEVKGHYQLMTFLQSDFDEVTRSPRRNMSFTTRDRVASTASFTTNGSTSLRLSVTPEPLPSRHPKFFNQLKPPSTGLYGQSLTPNDATTEICSPSFATAASPSMSFGQDADVLFVKDEASSNVYSVDVEGHNNPRNQGSLTPLYSRNVPDRSSASYQRASSPDEDIENIGYDRSETPVYAKSSEVPEMRGEVSPGGQDEGEMSSRLRRAESPAFFENHNPRQQWKDVVLEMAEQKPRQSISTVRDLARDSIAVNDTSPSNQRRSLRRYDETGQLKMS